MSDPEGRPRTMRSRRVLAVAVSALVVMIFGVGVSVARGERSPSPGDARAASAQATAFETDVAKRLGTSRATLEAGRKAVALADVAFAEDNGFISSTQANFLRKAIRSEPGAGPGPLGLEGHLGFGVGLGGFPLLGPTGVEGGLVTGRLGGRSDTLAAAASYLDLSEGRLMQSLRSQTLAQVA